MSFVLPFKASPLVTIPASGKIAAYSEARYQIVQVLSFANYPSQEVTLFDGVGAFTSAAFTAGASIIIRGGELPLFYSVGAGPVIIERTNVQGAPGTLNATGTLTAALVLGGIVTSTTAAGVTATLDTGTIMDAANSFAINDAFEWTVINTGPETFTVTAAASGHTVVGAGAVATATSGRFLTRKTAAATFVTYRIA